MSDRQQSSRQTIATSAQTPETIQQMLHELQVHQFELKIQNEELRTVQNQLEAGRERYFNLYDLAPVGYCTVSEKGLILEANLKAATLLGTTRSALVKQPITRFIFKEDQDIYYLHQKQLFASGEPQDCELRLVKPDGSLFWVHLAETATQAEDGATLCYVVLSDITSRKQTEEELRESTELFSMFMAHSPIYAFIKEVTPTESRVLQASENYDQMIGICGSSMIGKTMSELFPAELAAKIITDDWAVVSTGKVLILDEELNGRSYTSIKFPIQRHDKILLAGYTIDITERKKAEKALSESEAALREAQDIARLGRWELDLVSGQLTWSEGIFTLFEVSRADFTASYQAFLSFVHPDDRLLIDQTYQQSVAQKTPYSFEHRLLLPDGRIKWVSELGRTIYGADGTPVLSVGTVQDITEHKLAEEKIFRAMKEKDVLLREIHHRVKNNMQIIHSLLNIQAKGVADPLLRACLTESRDRVNAMALIHDQLYQSSDLAEIDFRCYLQSLVKSIASTYHRSEVGVAVTKGELLFLNVNLGIPCGLIVNELVTNSFRHAFAEGRRGKIQVGVSRAGDRDYQLTVSDDGIGLPVDFEFSDCNTMGLKLVQILVEQLGAEMTLVRGAGTSFTFSFSAGTTAVMHSEAGHQKL